MYPYKDYTKLGGWLVVFIVWSALQMLVNLALGIGTLALAPAIAIFTLAVHVGLRGVTIGLLLRKDRRCAHVLIAEGAAFVLECLYTIILDAPDYGNAALVTELAGMIVGGGLFYIGWSLYFRQSVRAQAYFSGVNPAPGPYQPGFPPYQNQVPPQQPPVQTPGGAAYCPHCGRPVTRRGALFCSHCGRPLYTGTPRG